MKKGSFRIWVTKLYYDAMKERYLWGASEEDAREFFLRNKYWLKNQFKKEGKQNDRT